LELRIRNWRPHPFQSSHYIQGPALEVRDFLSGEFTPLPLADVMAVLRAREAGGTVKLTPKTGK